MIKQTDREDFDEIVKITKDIYLREGEIMPNAFVLKAHLQVPPFTKEGIELPKRLHEELVKRLAYSSDSAVVWVSEAWTLAGTADEKDMQEMLAGRKSVHECKDAKDTLLVALSAPEGALLWIAEVKDKQILNEKIVGENEPNVGDFQTEGNWIIYPRPIHGG